MKVSLSILTVNYAKVDESLKELYPDIDYIHMDVMDGNFVPNISFGPEFVKSIAKNCNIIIDTHLMIQNPDFYIPKFAQAGSHYITFHLEASKDIDATIDLIKKHNCKAGISIKPNTSVSDIEPYLANLDMVLIMSVEPGFGGQKFMEESILKVKQLKELREEHNYSYLINIDGGINNETASKVKDYVDIVVSGSYVINAENPKKNLLILKHI